MSDMNKKLKKLMQETKTPFSHVAKVCGVSPALLRYYMRVGLTEDQEKKIKQWASKQASEFMRISL